MRRTALSIALLLLAIGLLLAVAAPVFASPQPDPVCGACGSSFEHTAEEQGLAVNVTHSTATVQIHANGSATWVVTNRINESAAARLSENSALRDRVARRAATDGWGLPHVYDEGQVIFQSASVDGRTVRIQFRDPDAGTRHLGILIVDYVHSEGVRGGWILNADRFTLTGPAETAVVNDPRAAIDREYSPANAIPEVTDENVTWHGSALNEYSPAFYDDVYIAYGGTDIHPLQVAAAVALATAPIWLDNVIVFVLPAVAIYGLLLLGVTAGVRWATDTSFDPTRIAIVVAGLGFVAIVAAVLAEMMNEPSWFAGVGAIYLVTGGAAVARPDAFRSVRGTLTVALISMLGVGAVLLGIGIVDHTPERLAVTVIRGIVFHLPLAVVPAFGLAVARADERGTTRTAALAFIGALTSLAFAGMVFVPYDSRPWGLLLVFTVGGAVAAALFGLPLAILAARPLTRSQL